MAVQVMAEAGIDISTNRSKSTEEFRSTPVDLVITVCEDAAEDCPVWLGGGARVHLGVPDPAKVTGDEDTIHRAFQVTRDSIRQSVIDYLTTLA
jgi:arsenate reductase